MNNSEQITTFLIVAVLILAAAPIPALTVFAGGTATVSLADFDAKPVSTIKVPLMIYNVTSVVSGELNISFDPSVVHLTDISDGDIGTTTSNINNDAGWAYMNVLGTEGKSGDAVFANLNLTAVGSEGDKSPLNISVISLFDTNYINIPYNTDNGTFAIREKAPTMPEMHVGNITMSSKNINRGRWAWYKAIATIPILDSSYKSVDGTTVEGQWSGAYSSNTVSGTTSNDGNVTFETKWVKGVEMFTFTVDKVIKEEWTYNESANIETSDSITSTINTN